MISADYPLFTEVMMQSICAAPVLPYHEFPRLPCPTTSDCRCNGQHHDRHSQGPPTTSIRQCRCHFGPGARVARAFRPIQTSGLGKATLHACAGQPPRSGQAASARRGNTAFRQSSHELSVLGCARDQDRAAQRALSVQRTRTCLHHRPAPGLPFAHSTPARLGRRAVGVRHSVRDVGNAE